MTISTDLIGAAAAAVASALPVPSTLSAGIPVEAAQFTAASSFPLPLDPGAAVVCYVGTSPGSGGSGEIGVIVDSELVQALATSPMGPLDLALAVQPALDAASHAATGGAASAAQQCEVDFALSNLLARPGAHLVALSDPYGLVIATLLVALDERPEQGSPFVANDAPLPAAASAGFFTGGDFPTNEVRVPRQAAAPENVRTSAANRNGLDLLRDVAMEITVELGRTRMTVRELLSLTPGAVVELDRAAGSPADLLVNGTLIARGEVVVVDEDFGIRITEIVAAGADAASTFATGPGAA